MTDDPFDSLIDMDLAIGADEVKCPHCGAVVTCSIFFDDEIKCPKCGKKFKKKY